VFALGQFAHNFSVPTMQNGVGAALGITGGNLKRRLHPYTLWETWRGVEAGRRVRTGSLRGLGVISTQTGCIEGARWICWQRAFL
jgi:hypothetical protein